MTVIIDATEEKKDEINETHYEHPLNYKSFNQIENELREEVQGEEDSPCNIPVCTLIVSRFGAESGAHILELVVATSRLCVYQFNGYVSG